MKKTVGIVIIALLVKVAYFVYAMYPNVSSENFSLDYLMRNDSWWYKIIADSGYQKITPDQLGKCASVDPEQSYYAFFPLYPTIIRYTMKATGGNFSQVAFFYSILLSLAAFLVFFRFVELRYQSAKLAWLATLFLMLFPFHFYFSTYYTESLFFLLLIGAFYSIEIKNLWLLALTTSLLVITRPNGAFMMVPLCFYFVERYYGTNILTFFKELTWKKFRPSLVFLVPIAAFGLYCLFLYFMTGDGWAFSTAQSGWCRNYTFPWEPFTRLNNWANYFHAAYALFFLLIILVSFRKIPLSFLVLLLIGVIMPSTAGYITAPRYISILFPFSILFAMYFKNINKYITYLVLLVLFGLQMWTFYYWLLSHHFIY